MGVEKGGRSMAANSEKTAKIRGPGKSGNPRGRPPLPPNAKQWATKDMGDLHEMSDDETVPVKVRADIKRWMVEMVYGKAAQAVDVDGKMENVGTTTMKFEGALDEWSQ